MFTGLIQATGILLHKEPLQEGISLAVQRPADWNDLSYGESIAINGACLTLESVTHQQMCFFASRDTLQKTSFRGLPLATALNLERSLRLGDRMGGHWVSGHIDGTATIIEIQAESLGLHLSIELPSPLLQWIVQKGSIAINGISLTINRIQDGKIELFIIPETLKRTNIGSSKCGDLVNVECDMMVKTVVSHLQRTNEYEPHT